MQIEKPDIFILNNALGLEPNVESKQFPDGEIYTRFLKDKSPYANTETAVVVASLFPNINSNLIKTFLATRHLAREYETIKLIAPYLPYARQDKIFLDGEVKSAYELLALFKGSGVSELITVDCHFMKRPGRLDYAGIKLINLSAKDLFFSYFDNLLGKDNYQAVSPDLGSSYMISQRQGNSMKKERGGYVDGDTAFREIKKQQADFEVKKQVVIFDDMIAGGGTMRNAIDILREKGAEKIYCAATHGLLLNNAEQKLFDKGIEQLVLSNSIPRQNTQNVKILDLKLLPVISQLI